MIKSIKNSIGLVLVISLILPGYVNANAKTASTLRKKAVALSVVSGACYWFAIKAGLATAVVVGDTNMRTQGRVIFGLGLGALTAGLIAGGVASSWYVHKLRQARKKELKG